MVVVALLFIILGSTTTSVAFYLLDASWGMIALAYLVGGWVGLLIGLPLTLYVRCLLRRHVPQHGNRGM